MVSQVRAVGALLLGSFFLLVAGGINGLILPVRGAAEGFSALWLGLLGTGWAAGYVAGCLLTSRLVARVGHIRTFAVMASVAAIAILAQLLFLTPEAWVPLRAVSGFCFAGAAMVVESWLGERAEPSTRGRIFGLYTMVNLTGVMAGQLVLPFGDTTGYVFFVLAAMFYALSVLPPALTTSASPQPLVEVRLDPAGLWRTSPVAVFAAAMLGLSNGAFGTLAPVYGERVGLTLGEIALFASLPILAGALAQIPVGYLSDRIDRRKVLVAVTLLALAAEAGFLLLVPDTGQLNLLLAAALGAAIFAIYPIVVAHANDNATGNYIQVSGGLLMVFGLGSMVGPLVAGLLMRGTGPTGLFAAMAGAHAAMAVFAVIRIFQRAAPATADKVDFVPAPIPRTTTPEGIALGATDAARDEEFGPEALGGPLPEARERDQPR